MSALIVWDIGYVTDLSFNKDTYQDPVWLIHWNQRAEVVLRGKEADQGFHWPSLNEIDPTRLVDNVGYYNKFAFNQLEVGDLAKRYFKAGKQIA